MNKKLFVVLVIFSTFFRLVSGSDSAVYGDYFYRGLKSLQSGNIREGIAFLQNEWNIPDSPWKTEAAVRGISTLVENEFYLEAQGWSWSAYKETGDLRLLSFHIFCLMNFQQWDKADQLLSVYYNDLVSVYPGETRYNRLLTLLKLNRKITPQLVIQYFDSGSSEKDEIYPLIISSPVWDILDEDQRQSVTYKYALSSGNYQQAYDIWRHLPNELRLPSSWKEIEQVQNLLRQIGGQSMIPQVLLAALDLTGSETQKYLLHEQIGQYYRNNKMYAEAREQFIIAESYGTEKQIQRMLWYQLDVTIKESPLKAVEKIGYYGSRWDDSDYFLDALENLMSELLRQGLWLQAEEVIQSVGGNVRPATMSALKYYQGLSALYGSDKADKQLADKYFIEAARLQPDSFYGRISAVLADLPAASGGHSFSVNEYSWPQEFSFQYLKGFFDYGLYKEGYELVVDQWKTLPAELIRWVSQLLYREELFYESYRLGWHLRWKIGFHSQDLVFLYPRAYEGQVEEISDSMLEPVFFSLMRTESAFNPEVESGAGAQGLCQLLPSTAADVAGRTGLKDSDLFDPDQNIPLGIWFFNHMIDRTTSLSKALASYNAGNRRVQSWENQFGDFSELHFLEAIPYRETRNYVKKVLESSFYYSYLYGGVQPEELALLFFPDINLKNQE